MSSKTLNELKGLEKYTVGLGTLMYLIVGWFTNKNIFGIVLSSLAVVITIPGILFFLGLELISWTVCLVLYLTCFIWRLGNRRKE